jgi:MFS family permease
MSPPQDPRVRRLSWALLSSLLSSAYGNLTLGTITTLFYAEMGLPKTHIGLLNALIFLPGPLALVAAPLAARWGFKRTYMWFYSGRKFVVALLAASPWVLDHSGLPGLVAYTTAVMLVFGILRVIAETAFYPWNHEYVPQRLRGQFGAISNIISTLGGLGAIAWAGSFLTGQEGFASYQKLILIGSVFGLASVLVKMPIKGGGPNPSIVSQKAHFRHMRQALSDQAFRRFLWGLGIVALSTHAWYTFLPLYMKDEVGLDSGTVVALQTWVLLGTLFSSYVWGWASDRFGSRPVLLVSLGAMLVLPPIWLCMPKQDESSLLWAIAAAALWGAGSIGYSIGHERQLYVDMVPAEKKTEYMALYYTWTQMTAVISPLWAGWGLDRAEGWQGEIWGIALGSYAPFFVLSFVGLLVGTAFFLHTGRIDKT